MLGDTSLEFYWPYLLYCRWLAECLVFMGGFAVAIHLASLIPRRNPWAVRFPWLIPAHYVTGAVLALGFYVQALCWEFGLLPADYPVESLFVTTSHLLQTYVALMGLLLLGRAAQVATTPLERRQALTLFSALALYGAFFLSYPIFKRSVSPFVLNEVLEAGVLAGITLAFYVSIFGFRLFNLRLLVRRSLIYALTSTLLAATFYLALVGTGLLATHALQLEPDLWSQALLLILLGSAFRTLARQVESAVDRLFFREKLELRRLPRRLIPELAGVTDIDELSSRLVRRLVDSLQLESAALLVGDQERRFYRVRGLAGRAVENSGAGDAVLAREQLEACRLLHNRRPLRWPPNGDSALPDHKEVAAVIASLDARYLLPIAFNGDLVGYCCLGATASGAELDEGDFEQLEILALQTSTILENARLFELGRTDPLTRLPRRQVFEERATLELERCRRVYQPFALLITDIDNFKKVNDTWGHVAGDQVLRAVGSTFAQMCRRIDLVARFGGEEFVFLFPETSEPEALNLAERLREALEKQEIPISTGPPLRVTTSIGLCLVRPDDVHLEPATLLQRADDALCQAKKGGKNRVAQWRQQTSGS